MGRAVWIVALALAFGSAGVAEGQPPLSDAVTGQVLTPDGKPAVGATVWLVVHRWFREKPEIESTAKTDEQGHFRLPFTPPLRVNYAAVVAHLPPFSVSAKEFDPRDLKPLTLRLFPAQPLEGFVVTPDGRPLEGATVIAEDFFSSENFVFRERHGFFVPEGVPLLQSVTDAKGRFAFPFLPANMEATLRIRHPNYPEYQPSVSVGQTDVVIVMPPVILVEGQVLRNGQPVPRAQVRYQRSFGGRRDHQTLTDDQGRFRAILPVRETSIPFDILASFLFFASSDDGQWQSEPVVLPLAKAKPFVTLNLQRAVEVQGVVKSEETGAPIPFAEVVALQQLQAAGPQTFFRDIKVKADEQGRFRLFLLPGEWDLFIWASLAPGHSTEQSLKVTVKPDEPQTNLTVLLRTKAEPAALKVRVVNEKGEPVAKAKVSDRYTMVELNENGEGVFPGRPNLLWAASPDFRTYGWAEVSSEASEVTIVVRQGVPVRGQVCDEQGNPIANATVTVYEVVDEGDGVVHFEIPYGWFTIATDARGEFECYLPTEATFLISAKAEGFWFAETQQFTLKEGQPLTLPPLRLPRAEASIEGVVVDEETGQPVVGAEVSLFHLIMGGASRPYLRAYTDFSGQFRFKGLGVGNHPVSIAHPAYREIEREFLSAPATNVRLTMGKLRLPHPVELAEGQPAPPLTDVTWLDGEPPSFEGTATYLLFATPFDPNCEEMLEKLKAVQVEGKGQVAVIFDASLAAEELRQYAKEKGLPFRIGVVPPGRLAGWDSTTFQRYGVKTVPLLVIVNEQGVVTAINPSL